MRGVLFRLLGHFVYLTIRRKCTPTFIMSFYFFHYVIHRHRDVRRGHYSHNILKPWSCTSSALHGQSLPFLGRLEPVPVVLRAEIMQTAGLEKHGMKRSLAFPAFIASPFQIHTMRVAMRGCRCSSTFMVGVSQDVLANDDGLQHVPVREVVFFAPSLTSNSSSSPSPQSLARLPPDFFAQVATWMNVTHFAAKHKVEALRPLLFKALRPGRKN